MKREELENELRLYAGMLKRDEYLLKAKRESLSDVLIEVVENLNSNLFIIEATRTPATGTPDTFLISITSSIEKANHIVTLAKAYYVNSKERFMSFTIKEMTLNAIPEKIKAHSEKSEERKALENLLNDHGYKTTSWSNQDLMNKIMELFSGK
jgi:hypothetical protein